MLKRCALATLFTALSVAVSAQGTVPGQADKMVTKENTVTATVTIQAIDYVTRSITLRSESGNEDTFTVGPDVKRFNELKTGDKIRATYYESLVFHVRKPGAPSVESGAAVGGGRLKEVPGAALGAQETTTVTVKAIDASVPSITVVTADGRTLTRKIRDKKNLEGVKAGDRIDITYTQALVVNAEPAK